MVSLLIVRALCLALLLPLLCQLVKVRGQHLSFPLLGLLFHPGPLPGSVLFLPVGLAPLGVGPHLAELLLHRLGLLLLVAVDRFANGIRELVLLGNDLGLCEFSLCLGSVVPSPLVVIRGLRSEGGGGPVVHGHVVGSVQVKA